MSNLRYKLKEILEAERIGNVNRSEAQAAAILAFWDEQKKGMRETIRLEVDEWVGNNLSTPMLESELDDIANQITASLVPIQCPNVSCILGDYGCAKRLDEAQSEIARLTKELEEARGEVARLKASGHVDLQVYEIPDEKIAVSTGGPGVGCI